MHTKISYIRRVEKTEKCHICNGYGQRWETEYHNQVKSTACFYCNGRGEKTITEETNITPEITILLRSNKKLTNER